MKLNRIAIGGVAGIMGLGLIGVGAHAAFTTSTTSHQPVSTGTLTVVLHATSNDVTSGNTTNTLVLKASTGNGSSFTAGTFTVKITNKGTLTATIIRATVSANPSNSGLATHVWVCIASAESGNVNTDVVEYNGYLSTATFTIPPGSKLAHTNPSVATSTNTYFRINVFAGPTHTTACGDKPAGTKISKLGANETIAPALTNTAKGESITVKTHVTFTT